VLLIIVKPHHTFSDEFYLLLYNKLVELNRYIVFILGFLAGGLVLFAVSALFPRIVIQHTTIQQNTEQIDSDTAMVLVKPKKKDSSKQDRIERVLAGSESEIERSAALAADSVEPEIQIVRERLIGSKTVTIQFRSESRDTSSVGQLNAKFDEQGFNKTILVEFWESPLDFMGYKLSKTKLILYGFLPQEVFTLTNIDGEGLVMEIDGKSAVLRKTEKYRPLAF
jgi:hypothetical protein